MQRLKGQRITAPRGPKEQVNNVSDGSWANESGTFLDYNGQYEFSGSLCSVPGTLNGDNINGFNEHASKFNDSDFHGNGDFNSWAASDLSGNYKEYNDCAYFPLKAAENGIQQLSIHEVNSHGTHKGYSNYDNSYGSKCDRVNGDVSQCGPDYGHCNNGGNNSKKSTSWANVASQPAKMQPIKRKDKITFTSILPGRRVDNGNWDNKNCGPKAVAPPPAPRPAWQALRSSSRTTPTTQSTISTGCTHEEQPAVQNTPSVPPPPLSQSPPCISPPAEAQPPIISNENMHNDVNYSVEYSSQRHNSTEICEQSDSGANDYMPKSVQRPPMDEEELSTEKINSYNPKEFELSPKNARYFVIKSYSEDDIHRSIKYCIWCSTERGNKRLDTAYREQSGKGLIYLFYSVNGSGHFCGIAEMTSPVDYNSSSSVWAQDKWKGQFQVKWIYVKDVPNNMLRHIQLENNENKPVTNSRDTQEVPSEKGLQVIKIIHSYNHSTSIFDDFVHYEKRQEESESRRGTYRTHLDTMDETENKVDHRDGMGYDRRSAGRGDYYRGGHRGRGGYDHHVGAAPRDFQRDFRDHRRPYYGATRGRARAHYHNARGGAWK